MPNIEQQATFYLKDRKYAQWKLNIFQMFLIIGQAIDKTSEKKIICSMLQLLLPNEWCSCGIARKHTVTVLQYFSFEVTQAKEFNINVIQVELKATLQYLNHKLVIISKLGVIFCQVFIIHHCCFFPTQLTGN